MTALSSTKFEISRFNASNYPTLKLKTLAILIKDGCAVALKDKENKSEGMIDKVFVEKDELTMANIYLTLNEVILLNVSEETTAKCLWEKLQIY